MSLLAKQGRASLVEKNMLATYVKSKGLLLVDLATLVISYVEHALYCNKMLLLYVTR